MSGSASMAPRRASLSTVVTRVIFTSFQTQACLRTVRHPLERHYVVVRTVANHNCSAKYCAIEVFFTSISSLQQARTSSNLNHEDLSYEILVLRRGNRDLSDLMMFYRAASSLGTP